MGFEKERTNSNARKIFLTSLWYLPCWMTLFLLHSKKWTEDIEDCESVSIDNDFISYLKERASKVRRAGKELCMHEIAQDDEKRSEECPIVFGRSQAHNVENKIEDVAGTCTTEAIG